MDEILSHSMDFGCPFMQSLPARGAWIEIIYVPNGVWYTKSRSPQGERGLKSMPNALGLLVSRSLPARGAWIEIEL